MTKKELLQHVIQTLKREKGRAEQSFEEARRAVIEAPGAMQSHSDTTKWQMSRIADAIQRSINEKDYAINTLQDMANSILSSGDSEVKIGSIVEVRTAHDEQELYFILPVGSGTEVVDGDRTILVLAAQSPLATSLIGKRENHTIKLQIGHQQRELTIVSIQ